MHSYLSLMKKIVLLPASALISMFLFSSCAEEPQKKPVGPVSETSPIAWNTPIPGQGQGQMGMMPQNQHRR
jgi:hypothetical protein